MTCSHCVKAVQDELGELPGVEAVTVELVAGQTSTVKVDSTVPLDRAVVAAAIEEAGYQLLP
jgi:copper chaperone CopZ